MIKAKTSKAAEKKEEVSSVSLPKQQRILTAEGWRRAMLKKRKQEKEKL